MSKTCLQMHSGGQIDVRWSRLCFYNHCVLRVEFLQIRLRILEEAYSQELPHEDSLRVVSWHICPRLWPLQGRILEVMVRHDHHSAENYKITLCLSRGQEKQVKWEDINLLDVLWKRRPIPV